MIRRAITAAAALALVACQQGPAPARHELRAWRFPADRAAEATADHRLVGLGCGPFRLTMTASEEDHFPTCDTIATVPELCPEDMSQPPEWVEAWECARYLGDGW